VLAVSALALGTVRVVASDATVPAEVTAQLKAMNDAPK
jgi:hypothetical protein